MISASVCSSLHNELLLPLMSFIFDAWCIIFWQERWCNPTYLCDPSQGHTPLLRLEVEVLFRRYPFSKRGKSVPIVLVNIAVGALWLASNWNLLLGFLTRHRLSRFLIFCSSSTSWKGRTRFYSFFLWIYVVQPHSLFGWGNVHDVPLHSLILTGRMVQFLHCFRQCHDR